MARRENQGLHIALISCVITIVIFFVLTYFFWSRSSNLESQLADLRTENANLNSEKGKAVLDAERLKGMIGYSSDADVNKIEEEFKKDMLTYGGSLPEVERTYNGLPNHLKSALDQKSRDISELSASNRELTDQLVAARKQFTENLNKAKDELARSEAEKQKITEDARADRAKLDQDKSKLAQQFDEARVSHQEVVAQKDASIEDLGRRVSETEIIAQRRQNTIDELRDETLDTPDGQVKYVNPTTRTVYINLGGDDGLKEQVTFSVFGVDVNNLAKETPKGKIEVTRIIRGNLAEARITDDDISDPILSGDAIYTPVWDAKSSLRFALAGEMDVNGDGMDDRKLIKNMLMLNNGRIDAEDVDGELRGQITRNTRYLVISGAADSDEATDDSEDAEPSISEVESDMHQKATSLGVEIITIDRLLQYMGYNGEKRIIPLGRRARVEDFPAKPSGGVIRSSRNDS